MVPGARLELARPCDRGILSPLRLPVPPPGHTKKRGWGRNRTGVGGFAGRCITTLPPSRKLNLERETRIELATPTLARLCSTAELFPQIFHILKSYTHQMRGNDYGDFPSKVKRIQL